ncbi:hypothetical protein [Paenibacillus macquariensis]|nr:hypothetical protein [Paenibacillus macquariensis]MEC0092322.1 hypothetical protein [Paenibacillus macquariensis]
MMKWRMKFNQVLQGMSQRLQAVEKKMSEFNVTISYYNRLIL